MVVAQIIPALVKGTVEKNRLIQFCREFLDKNKDIGQARDKLHTDSGKPLDECALDVVKRNPNIEETLKRDSWDV